MLSRSNSAQAPEPADVLRGMLKFLQPSYELAVSEPHRIRARQLPAREAPLSLEQQRALALNRTQPEGSQAPAQAPTAPALPAARRATRLGLQAQAPEPAVRKFQQWRCP